MTDTYYVHHAALAVNHPPFLNLHTVKRIEIRTNFLYIHIHIVQILIHRTVNYLM